MRIWSTVALKVFANFVYSLKNHGVDDDIAGMFDMGAETMRLPFDEKMRFEQGDDGWSFGSESLLLELLGVD